MAVRGVSDTYTKLFASITESTIWGEPAGTRLLWITFLAKANRHGEVYGSVPGMARLANITLRECEQGLQALMAPDPYSRTPDNEGRRIEAIDGGWRILNHAKFDRIRSQIEAQERERERKRQWDREHRGSRPNAAYRTPDVPPTAPDTPPTPSDPPPTPTVSKSKEQRLSGRRADRGDEGRFPEWWAVYPKPVKRKVALGIWQRRKLDAIADQLIADVQNRVANDDGWQRGYAPDPTTYLNQDRWTDALRTAPTARAGPAAQPSKTRSVIERFEEMKHGLARTRTADRVPEAALLGTGSDPGD